MRTNKVAVAAMLGLFCLTLPVCAGAQAQGKSPIGPGKVIVHSALGGFILGYDIDQTGTEGILSEAFALGDGKANVAVETFDQRTGKIIKILSQQSDSKNDFVTFGIFGNHVALTEFEHVTDLFVDKRLYVATIAGEFDDIRGRSMRSKLYAAAPDDYGYSQRYAHRLYMRNRVDGIVYNSVRHPGGQCVAAFWPDVVGIPVQERHLNYEWNGEKVLRYFDYQRGEWEAL